MHSKFSRLKGSFHERIAAGRRCSSPAPARSNSWSSVKDEFEPTAASLQEQQQEQQPQQQQRRLCPQQADHFAQKLDDSPTNTMMLPMMDADRDYYLDVVAAASLQQQQQQQQKQLQQRQQHQHIAPLDAHLKQAHHQRQLFGAELASPAEPDDYDDYAVPADESCCRLDRSQVELVQLIGEGQKGYVFLGKLQSKDGQSIIDVAIKTLKFETEQLIERLMNEAAMMKQLEHPHIIKFIGMCPETPALIAMELAQFGEIKHYLRLNRHLIKCSQLVLFSFQISTALSYLESKNYVHRDVAARNVLVCSHNCVKLADFGLSRNLQPNFLLGQAGHQVDEQRRQQQQQQQQQLLLLQHQRLSAGAAAAQLLGPNSGPQQQNLYVAAPRVKLPVRWLAPESLVFRRFTSASDVWMFAVCTWEFFQFGQVRPWAELRNNQVLAAIESGQRLVRPAACPERLYQLMLRSWSYAPVQRPNFREIKQCIWSIYLSERTREQLELERQQHLMMLHHLQQQQQRQHRQTPLLAGAGKPSKPGQEQLLVPCDRTQAGHAPAGKPGGSSPNVIRAPDGHGHENPARQQRTPSSNYSSTLTTTTTTDNEQSISPCSSAAFDSMGRPDREPKKQPPDGATRNLALKAQLSRFEQRQAQAPVAGSQSAHIRPHVLQKQRSQGAIGISTNAAGQFGPAGAGATRRSNQMQPLDDEALEYVKRGLRQRRQQATASSGEQSPGTAYFPVRDIDAETDDEDEAEGDDELDDEQDEESDGALWSPARRFLVSPSPALTADVGSQSRVVSIEPAYEGLAVAPAGRDYLHCEDQVAMLRANFNPSDSSRLSPGRPLTSSPALTSSNSPSRPASWRSTPAASADKNNNHLSAAANVGQLDQVQRPTSRMGAGMRAHLVPASKQAWTAKQQQQQQQRRRQAQPDQLSRMLQELRITPMKAKLRSSPEQSVRVLQREERNQTDAPQDDSHQVPPGRTVPAPSESQLHSQRPESRNNQSDDHTKQLVLHQRLLGRIRPNSSSPSPLPVASGAELALDRSTRALQANNKSKRPKSQIVLDKSADQPAGVERSKSGINSRLPNQNKSVEIVDHSLQILESLLSDGENGPRSLEARRASQRTASLPRRAHR
jgi:serine/threonine protein kinase